MKTRIKFVDRRQQKFYRAQVRYKGQIRVLRKKFKRAREAAPYGERVMGRYRPFVQKIRWAQQEAKAQADIEAGRVERFENIDELLETLEAIK